MKQAILVLLTALCAGCGSFEWFPKNDVFQNTSTAAPTPPPAAVISKSVSFPSGVTWISDLAFDKSSATFWLLAKATSLSAAPDALVKFNPATGVADPPLLQAPLILPVPATIVDGSFLAFDGVSFFITSNGFNNSIPVSEIYQFNENGFFLNKYDCPATSTGFCQGLTWDSTTDSFWVAGSDNKNLVNFSVSSGVATLIKKTYKNRWGTNGVSDIGFDSATNHLLVLKGGMIPVNAANGNVGIKNSFTLPGNGRGDWDGSFFWVIDNTNKLLDAVVVK